MQDKPVVHTSVEQTVVDDLSDIFGGKATAAGIVEHEPAKPNIFSKEGMDTSFLDNNSFGTNTTVEKAEAGETVADNERNISTATIDTILGTAISEDGETEDGAEGEVLKKNGRPKTDRSALADFFKKQIERGQMFAFDDYDEQKESLDDYLGRLSSKDYDELWDANHKEHLKKSQEDLSRQFFESMPAELQYAYKYLADGGQDLKGLFKTLSQAEETRALDVENEEDQEKIYRQYLQSINFGTNEEIEEELNTWKDLGQLDKKAKQAKPKLDKIQEELLTQRLQQQEQIKQQEEAAAQAYVEYVYKALEPGEVNGLRLDKKTQSFLYNAMVSAQYPSITGKPTNLLGHLLEKYQFVEPNYELVTEALWLLSDPEGYRRNVKQSGANEAVQRTVRALKTEESRKVAAQYEQDGNVPVRRKITKPGNIFKRV